MTKHTVRVRALKIINGVEHVLLVKEKEQEKIKDSGEKFFKWPGQGLPGGRVVQSKETVDFISHLRHEAKREFHEETGLETNLEDFSRMPKIFPQDDGRNIYLFEVADTRGEIKPLDPDIISAEWVPRWQAYGDYGSHERHIDCSDGKCRQPMLFRSHEKLIHFPSWGKLDPQEPPEEVIPEE